MADAPNKKQLIITLPTDLHLRLKVEAAKRGIPVAELIRRFAASLPEVQGYGE